MSGTGSFTRCPATSSSLSARPAADSRAGTGKVDSPPLHLEYGFLSERVTAMVPLRPVISVREIPPCCALLRPGLPSIRSLVSDQPCAGEPRILQYLQQGVFGCFFP